MDVMTRSASQPASPPEPEPALRWSPAWVLEPAAEPTTLVLSAGADRRVAVDGVDPADRAAVERWQAGGEIGPGDLRARRDQARGRLLDRLVELAAVVPVTPPGPPAVVAADDRVAAALSDLLHAAHAPPAGLVVAVRTGAAWPGVPAGALHLGVDLSLHHTIVLGPLVAPGVSACLACLDARMAHRWPVAAVPPWPQVQRSLPVVAALVAVQLGLVAGGTSPLVNGTATWNLETGESRRESLYKLAGCPRCDTAVQAASAPSGRVALPWAAAS